MICPNNILYLLIITPILGILVLLLIPSRNKTALKQIGLLFSSITFVFSLLLWVWFDNASSQFQFLDTVFWIPSLNLNFVMGIDGVSLFLIILTTLLIMLCILASYNIQHYVKEYLVSFLLLDILLISVFCVLDVLLFYVFFESVLIPMFLIIGIWGSRERKIRAAYFFFLYTLLGSVLMLLALMYILNQAGTTDYETLLTINFTEKEQKILWLAFFASFATKVPMLPMHIWLPEAHVEAPTAGSVILAGVLLKLGTYGLIRFSLPLFPYASAYFTPFVYSLAAMAVVYTSFTAIRQSDFKRIIAYTSVAHMNLVIIGLFSFNTIGLEGAMLQSLSHGFVASALFLIIGIVYERHHTRMVKYYGGLVHVMPLYVIFFLLFTMANIGLPGTSSFVGEFLILLGAYNLNTTIAFIGATGMVLGGAYSLWVFNRISYGNLKTQYIKEFSDLNKRELYTLLPLAFGTIFVGIYPKVFLMPMNISILNIMEKLTI